MTGRMWGKRNNSHHPQVHHEEVRFQPSPVMGVVAVRLSTWMKGLMKVRVASLLDNVYTQPTILPVGMLPNISNASFWFCLRYIYILYAIHIYSSIFNHINYIVPLMIALPIDIYIYNIYVYINYILYIYYIYIYYIYYGWIQYVYTLMCIHCTPIIPHCHHAPPRYLWGFLP